MILEIIGAKIAIDVASSIATWCFNKAAADQRSYQRHVVDNTYRKLKEEKERQRELQQQARQAAWEAKQAAHQAHFELLNEVSDFINEIADDARQALKQFQAIITQNHDFLKSLALTPEQRAAIHECNDQLTRGCQRLHAYIGPYLRQYRSELHDCREDLRKHKYSYPSVPSPVLPESFPITGELLEFSIDELSNYPAVDLGHGQKGRFITASRNFSRPTSPLVGMVERYDRDREFWILSAARGELAMDISSGSAYRQPRSVMLAEWRGDARIGWWEHNLGEKVMLRFEDGALSQRMKKAPWGTRVDAFVQSSDYFVRRVRVGEKISLSQEHACWIVPCKASRDFWMNYAAASIISSKVLVREAGMQGDPSNTPYILRLASGHEYPIRKDARHDRITVGDQCGMRMGLVQESGKNLYVFLLHGRLIENGVTPPDEVTRLFSAISDSFSEQRDLSLLADADSLELRKYRAVLRAEFEASKRRKLARLEFTDWSIVDHPQSGKLVVQFRGDSQLSEGLAVRVIGEEEILGWSQECNVSGQTEVKILRERRRSFRDEDFPRSGKLEAAPMDRELVNKMDGIENFLSAAASEVRTQGEQQAFSVLRRELLGQFSSEDESIDMGPADGKLDEHQQRAVSLLSGSAPLVLIQGPPGTGKTHVISHAINRILNKNPKARIAITSQANPAVDEAVSKIQEAFPHLQIYRDYSAAAKEKYAALDRGVGIDHYHAKFISDLESASAPDDPRAAYVQSWFKDVMKNDSSDVEIDMKQILAQGSQILACTLSRLSGIAASAPAFDLVIVDEAAKASVPEAMVAANCAKRLALVGDHKQLLPYLDDSYFEHSAPTTQDQNLLKDMWNNSLFSRLWAVAPDNRKAFLAVMRRSRRPIAQCISSCFYDGNLIPGRDDRSPSIEFPLSLIWVDSGKTMHEPSGKTSIQNRGEVDLIFSALREISQLKHKSLSVAVIAFHKGQAELLKSEIKKRKPPFEPAVLTVDASQGGQWDVVLLTLARTSGGSGFVGNPNRLNVALSRAKELCIVVGSKSFAEKDRTAGSALSEVVRFMACQPRLGKWTVIPNAQGAIQKRFGFPPERRPVK